MSSDLFALFISQFGREITLFPKYIDPYVDAKYYKEHKVEFFGGVPVIHHTPVNNRDPSEDLKRPKFLPKKDKDGDDEKDNKVDQDASSDEDEDKNEDKDKDKDESG